MCTCACACVQACVCLCACTCARVVLEEARVCCTRHPPRTQALHPLPPASPPQKSLGDPRPLNSSLGSSRPGLRPRDSGRSWAGQPEWHCSVISLVQNSWKWGLAEGGGGPGGEREVAGGRLLQAGGWQQRAPAHQPLGQAAAWPLESRTACLGQRSLRAGGAASAVCHHLSLTAHPLSPKPPQRCASDDTERSWRGQEGASANRRWPQQPRAATATKSREDEAPGFQETPGTGIPAAGSGGRALSHWAQVGQPRSRADSASWSTKPRARALGPLWALTPTFGLWNPALPKVPPAAGWHSPAASLLSVPSSQKGRVVSQTAHSLGTK